MNNIIRDTTRQEMVRVTHPWDPDQQCYTTSVAIAIASVGRPAVLCQTVRYLLNLEYPARRIIICVPELSDASGLEDMPGLEIIVSPRGLTTQRNNLLKAASASSDILLFLDDDFVPAADFLLHIERAFCANPNLVIATGQVMADGILTGGLTMRYAVELMKTPFEPDERITDIYNAYGCNMAVRLEPIVRYGLRFDEQLPLYGWLEDVDFSRTIAQYGRSAMVWGARGAHLGVRTGRQSGFKLGYSQLANPVYLMRKRTMAPSRAIAQIGRNVLANIRGFLTGDQSIDRRGRLLGNLYAMRDLLIFRSSPSRILTFESGSVLEIRLSSLKSDRR